MRDRELLPCPFCGTEDSHAEDCYFRLHSAFNRAPEADLSLAFAVIDAWNRRAAVDKAQSIPDVWGIEKGFRWDGERQQHVPQLVIEFEPVSFDGPCDAKGWKDRDALASMVRAGIERRRAAASIGQQKGE